MFWEFKQMLVPSLLCRRTWAKPAKANAFQEQREKEEHNKEQLMDQLLMQRATLPGNES